MLVCAKLVKNPAYLLFECLQDLTGGSVVFTLATKCFIVDITTEENRTARLAITDAFLSLD